METRGINQANNISLGYLKSKKIEPATKAIIAQLDGADSVSISNSQDLLHTDALFFVNRKVYDTLSQKNSPFNQKDLVEVNKKLLSRANQAKGIDVTEADKNYYSSQSTAERIYNFATSFYETYLQTSGKEDSEESRIAYKKIIGDAIDDGFQQALAVLGDLPGNVSSEIQNTHDIIFKKLDDFVAGKEQTYSQKVEQKVNARIQELDQDKSGGLSNNETKLSADYFKELDKDNNGQLSKEEIVNEYKRLDQTKDLSNELLDSILNKSQSYEDIAKEASNKSNPNGFSFDFYSKNPKVAQAIISFTGDGKIGGLSEYLKQHPDVAKKILDNPDNLNEVIRRYKLDSVIERLQGSPITQDFLEKRNEELENLFNNSNLLDYFRDNKSAAERLVAMFNPSEQS